MVAGAAPPEATIAGMERMGFDLTHVYGLTEVYGPATICVKQDEWAALSIEERAAIVDKAEPAARKAEMVFTNSTTGLKLEPRRCPDCFLVLPVTQVSHD